MPSYSVQTDSPANHNHGSAAWLSVSPISFRAIDCCSNLSRPSGPLSRIGKGGGGIGQIRPRLPLERICAQYGFRFFDREKSKSVASAAKRQRGLQRGKLGSPLPCFASFCRSKRNAPAASRTGFAPCKIFATPLGAPQSCPEINIFCPPFSHASAYSSTATGFLARK